MSTDPVPNYQIQDGGGNYMSEQEANNLIKKYDKNGDSILTKDELTALIMETAAAHNSHHQQMKAPPPPPKKEEIMEASSGPLKMRLSRDEIRDIFLEHDIDGDGYLTRSELSKALTMCGSLNSFNKANYALKIADADGDNHINVDELEKVIDYVIKLNNLKK